MRVMVIIKGTPDWEAGAPPEEARLTAMGKFNEELVRAGVMLDGEGLYPSAKGARVQFRGATRTVIDGPFTEAKERLEEAGAEFKRAAGLTRNARERTLLLERAAASAREA